MITQPLVYSIMFISKIYYKMITMNLSKQQTLDTDPKAIQQINVTASLRSNRKQNNFFNIEEAKESTLNFSEEIEYCECCCTT